MPDFRGGVSRRPGYRLYGLVDLEATATVM